MSMHGKNAAFQHGGCRTYLRSDVWQSWERACKVLYFFKAVSLSDVSLQLLVKINPLYNQSAEHISPDEAPLQSSRKLPSCSSVIPGSSRNGYRGRWACPVTAHPHHNYLCIPPHSCCRACRWAGWRLLHIDSLTA